VQHGEPGELRGGLALVDLAVVGIGVRELPVRPVGHVVGQDVEDEPFLDGLPHRVHVERPQIARRGVRGPEQLEGLGLRGRGEREVGQRLVPAPGQRGGGEQVTVVVDVVTAEPQQHLLERCRGLPRLGRVGLVDDDREPLPAQPAHLLQDVREGLQRDDEDLRRLADQRRRDLFGLGAVVVADLPDDAGPVHELVDGVLELGVEHGPVGDHPRPCRRPARSRRCAGSTAGGPATRWCWTSPIPQGCTR
jgi:hypothetical protein